MDKRNFTTENTEKHGVFELKIIKFLRETPRITWFLFLLDSPGEKRKRDFVRKRGSHGGTESMDFS
jgi:hypothetical protein